MRNAVWLSIAAVVLCLSCKEDPAEEALKKANALFRKSDFGDAGPAFEEVLRLDPKADPKILEKAAFSYKSAGNYDKTAELLLRQAQDKPAEERTLLLRNIANMFLQEARQLDEAEHYFEEALKLDPKDYASLSWMAEIAAHRGGARNPKEVAKPDQLDLALQRYDQLISMKPEDPIPYVNKRIALIKYVNHLKLGKAQAEKDAEENKADKEVAGDFLQKAKEFQEKVDAYMATLDEVTKRFTEVSKAAKERADAGAPK